MKEHGILESGATLNLAIEDRSKVCCSGRPFDGSEPVIHHAG